MDTNSSTVLYELENKKLRFLSLMAAISEENNSDFQYNLGVNAWKEWVAFKNVQMEKPDSQPLKNDILQLSINELNYSLCSFIKDIRKPNGQEYAPDTIYYLCLGIQYYLFLNGRTDDIFFDYYYEKFSNCFNEIASTFMTIYNDSKYIVTRVEENHLWESKQFGTHSPFVLLNTLMFFFTKYCEITSVEEHMSISFPHVIKHYKRKGKKVYAMGDLAIRFYPPMCLLEKCPNKKKAYELQANELCPQKCPILLYEYYLSKCPKSVKTQNLFYLKPEPACIAESPLWYSPNPMSKEDLQKIFNRIKMVREINVALLAMEAGFC